MTEKTKTTLKNADFMIGTWGGLDYLVVAKLPGGSRLGVKPLMPFNVRVRLAHETAYSESDAVLTGLPLERRSEKHGSLVSEGEPPKELIEDVTKELREEARAKVAEMRKAAEKGKATGKKFKTIKAPDLPTDEQIDKAGFPYPAYVDKLTRRTEMAEEVANDIEAAVGEHMTATRAQIVEFLNHMWRKNTGMNPDDAAVLNGKAPDLKAVEGGKKNEDLHNVVSLAGSKKKAPKKAKATAKKKAPAKKATAKKKAPKKGPKA